MKKNQEQEIAQIYYDLFEFMNIYNRRIWCNINLSIPLNHLGVLLVLEHHQEVTARDMTTKLAISKQQLSVILNKLIEDQIIQKYVHPKDKRCMLFSLTPKGIKFLAQYRQHMRQQFIHYTQKIDNAPNLNNVNLEEFSQAVQKIKATIKSLVPKQDDPL